METLKISLEGMISSDIDYYVSELKRENYNTFDCNSLMNAKAKSMQDMLGYKHQIDPRRFVFAKSMNTLLWYKKIEYCVNKQSKYVICGHSPYTYKNVYCDSLFEKNNYDPIEYDVYLNYYNELAWKPDVIIYLYYNQSLIYNANFKPFLYDVDAIQSFSQKYEYICDEINCNEHDILLYKINGMDQKENVLNSIKDIIEKVKELI